MQTPVLSFGMRLSLIRVRINNSRRSEVIWNLTLVAEGVKVDGKVMVPKEIM